MVKEPSKGRIPELIASEITYYGQVMGPDLPKIKYNAKSC